MSEERSANAVDRRLGQRLRARRLEIGLSQERLADLLGITFQQVQKYEKGVNRIAASRLFEIASALEVPVGFFFDGINSSAAGSGVAEDGRDTEMFEHLIRPDAVQLLALFSTIQSPRVRRRIVDLVRALAEDEHAAHADGTPDERP